MNSKHIPVLSQEIIKLLQCKKNKIYIDATLGEGGHSLKILEMLAPDILIIGIDQDSEVIEIAKKNLSPFKDYVIIINDNFKNIKQILLNLGINKVDGIIADLGVSTNQLKNLDRGFSFLSETSLDMRMNLNGDKSAYDIVNYLEYIELKDIIKNLGEEKCANKIAKAICKAREKKNINSTKELSDIVCSVIPKRYQKDSKIHPATKTLQAIRIYVNDELNSLDKFIHQAVSILSKGARLCIISFHSLEDRIVKNLFKFYSQDCICPKDFPKCICNKVPILKIITKKPITPSEEEINYNPSSRSAKLRVAERL